MNRSTHRTSYLALLFIAVVSFLLYGYIHIEAAAASRIYDQILSKPEATAVKVVTVTDEQHKLIVPDWSLFVPGNIWTLVSPTEKLSSTYKVKNIINTTVPHAKDATQVSSIIESPLKRLVQAAQNDGYELMLSSAYRSVNDQQALYDSFVATKGKAMADLYVAKPGTSEHHTGLAVDFADLSSKCQADSNTCNLDAGTSTWLATHAYLYGFILRYPEGAKPTTGIAYEPWHYRYVGIPLATLQHISNLTLDEILEQLYPAFTKR